MAHTCDGAGLTLTCPPGTSVRVAQAFYGRNDSVTCMDRGRDVTSRCSARDALQRVMTLCSGKENCHLVASDDVFGTPVGCTARTAKTLQLSYICSSE